MNDMPTITITIEEYMHLRACENKCNAEDYRSLKDIKELLERKAKALDGVPIEDGGGACIGIYFSIANDLPSVYPRSDKPCNDCISRNEVDKLAYQYLRETTENHVAFYEHLLDLPSVTPKSEKPSGKWITNAPQYDMLNPQYICSECGNTHTRITPYCEMCGAKMFDPQERSDKDDKI